MGTDDADVYFAGELGSASLNWPDHSGAYTGYFALEGGGVAEYQIEIEADRGSLTPLPSTSDTTGLQPTSDDYYRRYRITAELNCEDEGFTCEGSWSLDIVYEQLRTGVRWLFTTEE